MSPENERPQPSNNTAGERETRWQRTQRWLKQPDSRQTLMLGAIAVVILVAVGAVIAAMGGMLRTPTGDVAAPDGSAECRAPALPTVQQGTLTLATADPSYPPWFTENNPANGKGFEGEIAATMAQRLGYDPQHVRWVRMAYNDSLNLGSDAPFDIAINGYTAGSITHEATLSSPYYRAPLVVVAAKTNAVAQATALSQVKNAKVGAWGSGLEGGAAAGLTPLDVGDDLGARQALSNGTVDALVMRYPDAVTLIDSDLIPATIVATLPGEPTGPTTSLLVPAGGALLTCINTALDDLKQDNTLANLDKQWLIESRGIRTLTP